MRPSPDVEWQFDGPEDRAAYRAEVGRLWSAWILGMAGLLFADRWVWVVGIVAVGAMLILARPLQARAEAIVPDDDLPEASVRAPFARSRRDRVLRELAFGEAPLRASGAHAGWIWGRRGVVVSTVAVFAFVLYELF